VWRRLDSTVLSWIFGTIPSIYRTSCGLPTAPRATPALLLRANSSATHRRAPSSSTLSYAPLSRVTCP
jgi:hypothetical protein